MSKNNDTSESSVKPFISRDCTTCLYGVAILLMILHHALGFPETFSAPYTFPALFNHDLLQLVARRIGKQCVAIYSFMGGFGLAMLARKLVWSSGAPHVKSYLKLVWSRLAKFYPKYWFIVLIMVPIGIGVGALRLDDVSKELFLNAIGLDDSFCETWWYVKQYVFMLLAFPLLDASFQLFRLDGKARIQHFALLAIPASIFGCLWSTIAGIEAVYTCIFILGMLFARGRLFERFGIMAAIPWTKAAALIILLFVFAARIALPSLLAIGVWSDLVLIVPLIWSLTALFARMRNIVSRALHLLGSHSTTIWLTHSLIIIYYFPHISLLPQHSALVFVWCVAISLGVGIAIDFVYDALLMRFDRIKTLLKTPQKWSTK